MKKALMNASVASMIYKFNMNNIDILRELGYQVDVACNFGSDNPISSQELSDFRGKLSEKGISIYETSCPRNVFALKRMYKAYKELKKLADEQHYDIVHTQSPIGGVVCRMAFRKARKEGTKIIYQAHGFHFYKGAPLVNWIFFFLIEKICSKFTDVLITINREDYELAKKRFKAGKVEYVPGVGIDLEKNSLVDTDARATIRGELGVPDEGILMLSVGELNNNKNHETVIRAIEGMKIFYAIAGIGEKKNSLEQLVESIGMSDRIFFLGFRSDVDKLMEASDIFVFPSYREGLSVSLMEAMAMGMPCIVSNIRGNIDLIDNNGGSLFNPKSIEDCRNAILQFDVKEKDKMRIYNQEKIKLFSTTNVEKKMKKIYMDVQDK